MKDLVLICLILVIIFFVRKFLSRFKFPVIGSLAVVTGAIKSGKSAFSLALAVSNYKRIRRFWRIKNIFRKLFHKPLLEEPLFYSNIPLSLKHGYCQLSTDHLMRKLRFNFGSVVFIDEASLVADSQLIKDGKINTQLLLFFKLFGHETHGGKIIVNTQQISDLHYALKRCTSQYFYITHISKYIPFFTVAKNREERFSEDGSTVNIYDSDIDDSMKTTLLLKSTFKKYDCFCFSEFTDSLPVKNDRIYLTKYDSLKINNIVSFRPEFANLEFIKKNKNGDLENEKENS